MPVIYYSYRSFLPALAAAVIHGVPIAINKKQASRRIRSWLKENRPESMLLVPFEPERGDPDPPVYVCSITVPPDLVVNTFKSIDGVHGGRYITALVGPERGTGYYHRLLGWEAIWREARLAVEWVKLEVERRQCGIGL